MLGRGRGGGGVDKWDEDQWKGSIDDEFGMGISMLKRGKNSILRTNDLVMM